jgi:hypothetical protein
MKWRTQFIYVPQYSFVSANQHGDRYEKVEVKKMSVAVLNAKMDDANDLLKLILIGDTLSVPVRYDFEKQEAVITLVSAEKLQEVI